MDTHVYEYVRIWNRGDAGVGSGSDSACHVCGVWKRVQETAEVNTIRNLIWDDRENYGHPFCCIKLMINILSVINIMTVFGMM